MNRPESVVAILLEAQPLETGLSRANFDARDWLVANDVETPQAVQQALMDRYGFSEGPERARMRYDYQFAAHKVYLTPVGPLTVLMHDYYDNDDAWIHLDVREAHGGQATDAGYWNMRLPTDGTDIFKLVELLDKKLTTMKGLEDVENLRVEFRPALIGHA